ncbi:hypothetical protein R1flu_007883 [Riccia fluitans]|uniref:Uncharacterized protein n=1 Tax=Riccia fluitans TaxID=41844 RepID=A0ABD1Z1B8_9MARC
MNIYLIIRDNKRQYGNETDSPRREESSQWLPPKTFLRKRRFEGSHVVEKAAPSITCFVHHSSNWKYKGRISTKDGGVVGIYRVITRSAVGRCCPPIEDLAVRTRTKKK